MSGTDNFSSCVVLTMVRMFSGPDCVLRVREIESVSRSEVVLQLWRTLDRLQEMLNFGKDQKTAFQMER